METFIRLARYFPGPGSELFVDDGHDVLMLSCLLYSQVGGTQPDMDTHQNYFHKALVSEVPVATSDVDMSSLRVRWRVDGAA